MGQIIGHLLDDHGIAANFATNDQKLENMAMAGMNPSSTEAICKS